MNIEIIAYSLILFTVQVIELHFHSFLFHFNFLIVNHRFDFSAVAAPGREKFNNFSIARFFKSTLYILVVEENRVIFVEPLRTNGLPDKDYQEEEKFH